MKKYLFSVSLILNFIVLAAGLYAIHKMGGLHKVIQKIKGQGVSSAYEHRINLFEMLPIQEGDIVFLGNSITAQNEWAEMFGMPNIKNRGIPGDHADGMLARLKPVASAKPAKIFLMAGINDLAFHPPDTVIVKVKRLVKAIVKEAPATQLYLQSILPVNPEKGWFDFDNDGIQKINEALRDFAFEKGIAYIDIYPHLVDGEGKLDEKYTTDGIHINGLAYLKWKELIEPFVKNE